ncbi:g protein-coupled receptor [Anaeramoeba flamelloides]|uniref:G protein-coupled receptor n=1 Tax=Anaeramoeba flamelloides TaxID=1746091 RepID=A0ABQ8XV98_9EUKA|nr:g protein-coupled receptor [Anaeramoeba flamelloides]
MFSILLETTTATKLAISTSVLSLVGSMTIIVLSIRFPDYRNNFFRKLIFYLSIYDALASFMFLIPGSSSEGFCVFQSFALVWLAAIPPYFSLCIAIITFVHIARNWNVQKLKGLIKKLHLVSHAMCFLLTILSICFAKSRNFPNSHWCFLEGRAILGVWYSVIWVCTIASCILYILIIHYIRKIYKTMDSITKERDIQKQRDHLKVQLRMSTIPLSLVLTWTIASVRRAREIFSPDSKQIPTLNLLQALTSPLQGFYDCIVFVILSAYGRKRMKRLLCCDKPGSSENTSMDSDLQE